MGAVFLVLIFFVEGQVVVIILMEELVQKGCRYGEGFLVSKYYVEGINHAIFLDARVTPSQISDCAENLRMRPTRDSLRICCSESTSDITCAWYVPLVPSSVMIMRIWPEIVGQIRHGSGGRDSWIFHSKALSGGRLNNPSFLLFV